MQNLYQVLCSPSEAILKSHSINYFDKIIEKYPDDWENIVSYINDCFNYHSPLLTEEKDWGYFLMERFQANDLSENLIPAIIEYECEDFVFGMASFLAHQKQTTFATLIAKQNLRISMLSVMQKTGTSISDKQKANEMVTSLDYEINDTMEKLRQSQKVFGNFAGYEQVKTAKNNHKINIAQWIE